MSLCVIGAAGVLRLAVASFTLSWVHSIEHTRWQEDWTVEAKGLQIREARIENMGAGMETPDGATFDGTWWRWVPKVPELPEVLLRRSSVQPQGWRLCAGGVCRAIADDHERADIVVLKPCP
jgi:hypothetical protein